MTRSVAGDAFAGSIALSYSCFFLFFLVMALCAVMMLVVLPILLMLLMCPGRL